MALFLVTTNLVSTGGGTCRGRDGDCSQGQILAHCSSQTQSRVRIFVTGSLIGTCQAASKGRVSLGPASSPHAAISMCSKSSAAVAEQVMGRPGPSLGLSSPPHSTSTISHSHVWSSWWQFQVREELVDPELRPNLTSFTHLPQAPPREMEGESLSLHPREHAVWQLLPTQPNRNFQAMAFMA